MDLILGVLCLPVFVISSYLFLITVGSFLLRKKCDTGAAALRIALVMPAHNEELQIAACVKHALEADYPRDRFDVFVIADNCNDATAEVARRAGAAAFERHDSQLRGKGQAIDWFLRTQRDLLAKYDAIALVDADTQVDRRFLAEVSASLSHPEVTVVQGWHGVSNPEANWRAALTHAGFTLINGLRPAGRSHWGGTADLKGNGMAFRRDILFRYGWPAHSIVEDIEFSTRLLLDGTLVHYNPDAVTISEMPTTRRQAEPQRRRWESGRWATVKLFVPMLLAAFAKHRRWRYLDAALEFLVPPLSLFVLIQAVLLIVALWVRPVWAWPMAACIAITATYVFSGLYQYRAPRSVWLGLFAVPLFLLWKIPFYVRLTFSRGPQSWERTQRHAELEQRNNDPSDKKG